MHGTHWSRSLLSRWSGKLTICRICVGPTLSGSGGQGEVYNYTCWLTPCERVKILCILSLCKHLISRNALTSAGSCGQLLFVGTLICKGLRKI